MSERAKKSCGHEVGYRCACHPLTEQMRRIPDVAEFMDKRQRGDLREVGEEIIDDDEEDEHAPPHGEAGRSDLS